MNQPDGYYECCINGKVMIQPYKKSCNPSTSHCTYFPIGSWQETGHYCIESPSALKKQSKKNFACGGTVSTFEKMKTEIETGWDGVLWSESYGIQDAVILAVCVYFGCALEYLGNRLYDLEQKVGRDFIENCLDNKGIILSTENTEMEANLAYWSVCQEVWNPIKQKCECITTERYVRLYIRWRTE